MSAVVDLHLVVAERVEAGRIVRLWLAQPDGTALPRWEAGAHLTLVVGELVRYYSLIGDPQRRDRYQIAVRLDAASSGGSRWIHQKLVPGARVGVRLPRNNFPLHPAQRYVFVAGGIGVTPLYAMAVEATRAGAPWELYYGASSRAEMVFLDELRELAASGGGLVHALPHDENGPLPVADLVKPQPDTAVYCCGPVALMDAVEDATHAWPEGAVHVERYVPRAI